MCEVCGECHASQESSLLICELCETGYHTFCAMPKLDKVSMNAATGPQLVFVDMPVSSCVPGGCGSHLSQVPEGHFYCWMCIRCERCNGDRELEPGNKHAAAQLERTAPGAHHVVVTFTMLRAGHWSPNKEYCPVCSEEERQVAARRVERRKAKKSLQKVTDQLAAARRSAKQAQKRQVQRVMHSCPNCNKQWSDDSVNMVRAAAAAAVAWYTPHRVLFRGLWCAAAD